MNETIPVLAASGKFAGLTVPECAARGARVRGTVRDEADPDYPTLANVEPA